MSTSNVVHPYLFFGGRCEEAIEFYRTALGAEVLMLSRFKDAPEPQGLPECFDDKVMHASLRIGQTFWASKFGVLQDRFGVSWMVSVMHKPVA